MTATIRDVAKAAGVSVTTVSHVLSGQGRVSRETKKKVEQVVAELGYRANVHAQQLVTRRSRTLGIQVARAGGASEGNRLLPNSEYFLELLNGAAEQADAMGYALILIPPGVAEDKMAAFGIDGTILVDPTGEETVLGRLDRPLVTTGRPPSGASPAFAVDNDHRTAAKNMLDHLRDAGYSWPALVVTDTTRSYTVDLMAGYLEWTHNADITPVILESSGPQLTRGARAVSQFTSDGPRPDALFASSEDLALDLLHELRREGFDVPVEIGLCSAVDSNALQLTSPTITGMQLHPREIGRRAASLLVDLVEDRPVVTPIVVNVAAVIAIRESTTRHRQPARVQV